MKNGSYAGSSLLDTNQYRKRGNASVVTDKEVLTHDMIMIDYSHDQDKMNASQIYALKSKTFPYLDKTDVRLKMSDRVIIEKELDLVTDSVLSETDRIKVKYFYYSCREYLSTHDNPSVQNKTFASLKAANLKPFLYQAILDS